MYNDALQPGTRLWFGWVDGAVTGNPDTLVLPVCICLHSVVNISTLQAKHVLLSFVVMFHRSLLGMYSPTFGGKTEGMSTPSWAVLEVRRSTGTPHNIPSLLIQRPTTSRRFGRTSPPLQSTGRPNTILPMAGCKSVMVFLSWDFDVRLHIFCHSLHVFNAALRRYQYN